MARAAQVESQALQHKRPLLFDGGLATWLETGYGKNLEHHLWSTKVLQEEPKIVEDAHFDYLWQGDCDVIITCTYQTSLQEGFAGDYSAFRESLHKACQMADRARQRATSARRASGQSARPVLIAGSCGCYGAALANGAEYTGEYGFEGMPLREVRELLHNFHIPRMRILAGKDESSFRPAVNMLAAETIPVAIEGTVVSAMFKAEQMPGYVTFSCRNGTELNSGEPLRTAVAGLMFSDFLLAVGINCTPPQYVESLIEEIKAGISDAKQARGGSKEASADFEVSIVVYPNSGEIYCGDTKTWSVDPASGCSEGFVQLAQKWRKAGATWIGGCCRTTPAHIKGLRDQIFAVPP